MRRTGRTLLSMLGVNIQIAEVVLNHSLGAIVEVYDLWEYVPQKRQALERLGAYYAALQSRPAPTPTPAQALLEWRKSKKRSRQLGPGFIADSAPASGPGGITQSAPARY